MTNTPDTDDEVDEIVHKTVNWGRPEIVSKWYQIDSRYRPDSERPFLKPDEAKQAIKAIIVRKAQVVYDAAYKLGRAIGYDEGISDCELESALPPEKETK